MYSLTKIKNKRNLISYALFLLGAVVLIFGIFMIKDLCSKNSDLKSDLNQQNISLDLKKQALSNLESFLEEYKTSASSISKVKYAVPEKKDIPEILTQMEVIAERNSLQFDSITFGSSSGSEMVVSSSETIPEGVEKLDLELKVVGSQDNFKKYIKEIEENIRIIDIEKISIVAGVYNLNTSVYYLKTNE